jgi:transmembrane sensor
MPCLRCMRPRDSAEPADEVLFRFVAGRCTTAEIIAVERWIELAASHARRVEALREIWNASAPAPARDLDRMWLRLRSEIERRPVLAIGAGHSRRTIEYQSRRRVFSARGLAIGSWAAVLVALVGGGAVLVARLGPAAPAHTLDAPRVYATRAAQTANILLNDGSRVMLAPQSVLRVPSDFGARERTVTIEGEGFFVVAHNAAMPFRAIAKGAVAQDIGTRFDLRAYEEEPGVKVIVAEGAVALGRTAGANIRGPEGVVLNRGERGSLGSTDSTVIVDRVSLRLVGWTDGRLSFVNTPLLEISRTIGRWYDLDVRVADPQLARRMITADFDTQSPREMVDALALAVGGVVKQEGRVLTVRAKP